jgi:hypothetical protein
VVKNGSPQFTAWKANSSKTWKGRLGSLSKMAQVATRHNLHSKAIKIATGLDTHVLEGEGDIFSKKKKQMSTYLPNPLDLAKFISKNPL